MQESVPAALTKDKKRIHDEEIAVHLAWQSTLYVTNFPEVADDKIIRDLFGKVLSPNPFLKNAWTYRASVWCAVRVTMAKQEVQELKAVLLRAIHDSSEPTGTDLCSLRSLSLRVTQGPLWNYTIASLHPGCL